MSAVQDGLNGCGITQENYQKGLLSLPREIIIRILEKLNSEDLVNIADTCIELRKVVQRMMADDGSLSEFSIESIDELDCSCE